MMRGREFPTGYLLVYLDLPDSQVWWTRWLKRGFQHVEVWWHIGDDYYVALRSYHNFICADVMQGRPQGTVQEVVALRNRGSLFPFGMKTCVTVVKAALGLKAPWIMTPWQLHRHVEKHNGIV